MNAVAREWLEATYDEATANGRYRVLGTILGPIQVVDDQQHQPPPRINWPSLDVRLGACAGPLATLVITPRAASREIIELAHAPHATVSLARGRGAFPVRWVAGTPWVAQYENGPVVLRDGNRLLMTAATLAEADTWADRVLREMLIRAGRQQRYALCHGAVVAGDRGGGLLITGPSGAGKTDLALKLARTIGARIVTIDRGIVGHRAGRLAVGALPFGLNIHSGTLADLGCLDASLIERYPVSNDKHYLPVRDLEHHCQVKLTASATVTAIVRIARAQRYTRWERLDDRGVTGAVRTADTTATDPGFQVDWLGMATGASAPRLEPAVGTTGWSLDYNPHRPLPSEWIEEAARALQGAAANSERPRPQEGDLQ